eukprot:355371-Chlamydomonas_euryale.AAC.1
MPRSTLFLCVLRCSARRPAAAVAPEALALPAARVRVRGACQSARDGGFTSAARRGSRRACRNAARPRRKPIEVPALQLTSLRADRRRRMQIDVSLCGCTLPHVHGVVACVWSRRTCMDFAACRAIDMSMQGRAHEHAREHACPPPSDAPVRFPSHTLSSDPSPAGPFP